MRAEIDHEYYMCRKSRKNLKSSNISVFKKVRTENKGFIKDEQGKLVSSNREKVELLNTFFS